ncbi:hypothetical protein L6D94_15215, partial [Enterococcus faecium]
PFVLFLDIIAITPCIRFHKSIIKEKTVDIIHKMDFVYSLRHDLKIVSNYDCIRKYDTKRIYSLIN